MTKNIVLDASALLALLNNEEGALAVEAVLPNSIISAVNAAEVMTELHFKLNLPIEQAQEMIITLVNKIIPFDLKLAAEAAKLRKETKFLGLSLGDRACLALSKELCLPIYTADKAWAKLQFPYEIILIR